jgi:hypothetical protein
VGIGNVSLELDLLNVLVLDEHSGFVDEQHLLLQRKQKTVVCLQGATECLFVVGALVALGNEHLEQHEHKHHPIIY